MLFLPKWAFFIAKKIVPAVDKFFYVCNRLSIIELLK